MILVFFGGLALLAGLELGLAWVLAPGWSLARWRSIIALGMAGAGMALVIWSVRSLYVLGRGTPAPMLPTRQLVHLGPYRYSRNPMTLGAGLFYLGLAIWVGSWVVFGLVLLIFTLLLTYIYIHESRELEERFGVEYLRYRRATPFLIPRLPH